MPGAQTLTYLPFQAASMEALGKKSYHKRFLSAEGCYSHRAAHTPGLRIKVANKQFVGLAPTVMPAPTQLRATAPVMETKADLEALAVKLNPTVGFWGAPIAGLVVHLGSH